MSKNSKFTDHINKKGILYTPFNQIENLSLSSWALEWLPEYLWMSLILEQYGREKGIDIIGQIIKEISLTDKALCTPILSEVLNWKSESQIKYYEVICKWINPSTLAPLTLIILPDKYLLFNDYFSDISLSIDQKLTFLEDSIKKNLFHQTNNATDVRFLVIWFNIYADKLSFARGMDITTTLLEYAKTSHDDPKMRLLRPQIRASEIGMRFIEEKHEQDFANLFWNSLGLMTKCETFIIKYDDQGGESSMDFFKDAVNTIEYLMANNKDKLISDEKFSVCLGMATYVLKIYKEIMDNKIGDGILGRCGLRTITEVYVTLKYMITVEESQQNIWGSFKEYGIGKYKYIVLKAREIDKDLSQHHFSLPVLETLLNEDKNEEHSNMDTRQFDNKNVRKKFETIDENELYDLYYEYDTNYSHGFWGAIRESAMVSCNNPSHRYHSVPDITFEQSLRNVEHDCEVILKKFLALISTLYEFPDFYLLKYGEDA